MNSRSTRRNVDSVIFMGFISLVFIGITVGLYIENPFSWPFTVMFTLFCVHIVYWSLFIKRIEDLLKWFTIGTLLFCVYVVISLIYQAYQ